VGGKRVVTGVRNTVTRNSPRITGHRVTVTEIVASELMTAAGYGMTRSMSMEGVREPVSAQRVAAPAMTNATVGKSVEPTASMESAASTVKSGKSMGPTTSAVKPTTASAMKPTTASTVKAATTSVTTQSAQTATLVARMPIVFFFMTRSPFPSPENVVPTNARKPAQLYLTTISALSF
jgi:hypothetical protein